MIFIGSKYPKNKVFDFENKMAAEYHTCVEGAFGKGWMDHFREKAHRHSLEDIRESELHLESCYVHTLWKERSTSAAHHDAA